MSDENKKNLEQEQRKRQEHQQQEQERRRQEEVFKPKRDEGKPHNKSHDIIFKGRPTDDRPGKDD